MREILFRGKRLDNGEWVEGDLVRSYLKMGNACITDFAKGSVLGVDNATVGQYAGLTDKNGKRIFEGDVVRLDEDVKEIFGAKDGPVKYNHGAFFVNGKRGMRDSLFVLADVYYVLRGEVIGNIHDNPELVEA